MQLIRKKNNIKLKRSISIYLFLLIVLFGIFFRTVNLDKKGYWHDEIYTQLRVSGYSDIAVKNARFGKIISKQELMKFQGASKQNDARDILVSLRTDIHTPLYFVSLKYWQDLWGTSLASTKSFSAVFGVLSLYLIYITCQEIFNSILTARIAVSLMALSPIFIRYSIEARPYPMWISSLLLSTYLLLKALKSNDKKIWIAYAIALSASFYLHLLSFYFYIGHLVYVVATKTIKNSEKVIIYLFSSAIGFLLFIPWFLEVIIPKQNSILYQSAWIRSKIPMSSLINEQLKNITHLFISYEFSNNVLLYIFASIILALVLYSFFYLARTQRISSWLLVYSLGYSTILFLYQDIFSGGQRTRIPHYSLPCYIAIVIAVSYTISSNIISSDRIKKNTALCLFSLSIIISTVTNLNTISHKDWWGWSKFDHEIAEIINARPNPLIICNSRIGALMPVVHLLNENADFLMLDPSAPPILEIFDNYNNVYLISPSKKIEESLISNYNVQIKSLYQYSDGFVEAKLFKVTKSFSSSLRQDLVQSYRN